MFIPLHDQNKLKSIRLQYVTLFLIALNCLIWIISATPQFIDGSSANSIYYSYGFVPAVINELRTLPPDVIVLPLSASYVSYAFFHVDFMHLAGNMLFLWVFGDNVEDATGHFKFLVFFILCAIAGAIAHRLALPESEAPLIGASGAAAGVVGAYLVLHPKVKIWVLALGRIPLRLSAFWLLGAWIIFQVYSLFADTGSPISFASHVGGFLAGVVLIIFFRKRGVALWDQDLDEKRPAEAAEKPGHESEGKNPERWGRDAKQ